MSKYIIDANFFINAHRVSYPLDVVRSFWDTIKTLAKQGDIVSIKKVQNEINHGKDDLTDWCNQHLPSGFFRDASTAVAEYAKISRWLSVYKRGQYKTTAVSNFLATDSADPWLVSYAMVTRYTLVTHEISAPLSQKKVKIPDVCTQFQVKHCNTMQMFRDLGVTF